MMSRVERFTQRARRIMAAAQEEAETLRNSTIETPHLLLGMLRVEDSVAYRVLNDLKIDYDKVLPVGRSANPAQPWPPKTHDLSPEAKRVLESAMQLARQRGDQFIGSEHLLLSLIKGEDKSIRYLIRQLNIEPAVVRSCVERVLQQESEARNDSLPATSPFVQNEAQPIEETDMPEPSARTRVLQMVESGKISAAEGAELLKAMRFASVPVPGSSGFVLLPLDEVNFDDLRQRSLRFVVTDRDTHEIKAEVSLSFEQGQTQLFRLLSSIYGGERGVQIDLSSGADHLQVSLE